MNGGGHILPDVLVADLTVVFCGTAASTASAQAGAYYANPGNRFWPALYEAGFTPRLLRPAEYQSLLQWGYGLTDVAKQACGSDHQLAHSDFDVAGLVSRIQHYQPAWLAFTSKKAASLMLDRPTGQIAYGEQENLIGPTRLFVLPSPSGAARATWDLEVWRALAERVKARGAL